MPEAEPAQPRALIGGHIVSALAGLLVLQLTGPSPVAAACAVGLAIAAMHLTRASHPLAESILSSWR
jgi:CBS-domain-containing membrane protein